MSSIAYAVGLDPCVLFDSGDMSSSAARFIIAKSRDIVAQRLQDRISLCNKIYQFVLSCEVRAGRLPKCPAPDWDAVKWISNSFWSIDLQRDAKTAMELISRGLCSADDYCLQAFGRTAEEIFASNLHTISHNMKRAQDAGVPYHAVAAPAAGSTYTPPENVEPTPQEHPADDDGMIND